MHNPVASFYISTFFKHQGAGNATDIFLAYEMKADLMSLSVSCMFQFENRPTATHDRSPKTNKTTCIPPRIPETHQAHGDASNPNSSRDPPEKLES